MKIPDQVRKAVGFVAFQNQKNNQIEPLGTFFFLGRDPKCGEAFSEKVYAVTARHVIDKLRDKGAQNSMLRLNPKDYSAEIIGKRVELTQWFMPTDKSIDVAIHEIGVKEEEDHLVIPLSMCLTKEVMNSYEIGLGDEVFISGLFQHHFGTRRNIPIIRIGNLAALDEERISTEAFGEIEGFLVGARSTGGLSGSPVFVNLGAGKVIGGKFVVNTSEQPLTPLLGLVHGHFRIPQSATQTSEEINAGIAIIVSVASIKTVIDEYESSQSKSLK